MPVSTSTVKRRLWDAGLQVRVAKKKPYLRLANKRKRLIWAKEYRHWTEEDWKRVLWTDESKFEVFGSNRGTFVRLEQLKRCWKNIAQPLLDESAGTLTQTTTFPLHSTQPESDPAESQVPIPAYYTTLHGDKEEGADESAGNWSVHLKKQCYDYNTRAVTGDLCEDLCVTEKLMYKHCLYYQRGKKVLQADWQGTSIILKSKNDAFFQFQAPIFLDESDAQSLTDTELLVMVAVEIKNTLGLDLPNSTLLPLWPEIKHSPNWRVELASMWSLYQQEEYLIFNLLQDFSRHVLRVVGTCGHFYAVEFLSAGHSWKQNLFSLEEVVGQCKTGEEKMNALLDIAISFLDMVHQFDNEFSHRLHLCDVKPENFAIRSDLTVSLFPCNNRSSSLLLKNLHHIPRFKENKENARWLKVAARD
ncbi:unnamed protein product [Ranitomeya imitator]|uniref:FAM69 N-terminal domain-containing protein n=1 Tax=Ranitomeya imitator TaxID=111125 RepID=A0ABN9M7C1_9NEOB|nr:unnamed protein product [Ranitomeya imitator]